MMGFIDLKDPVLKQLANQYLTEQAEIEALEDELAAKRQSVQKAQQQLALAACPYSVGQTFADRAGKKAVLSVVTVTNYAKEGEAPLFCLNLYGRILKKNGEAGEQEVYITNWTPCEKTAKVPTLPSYVKVHNLLVKGGITEKGGSSTVLQLVCYVNDHGEAPNIVVYGSLSYRRVTPGEQRQFTEKAQAILAEAGIVSELDENNWVVIKPQ